LIDEYKLNIECNHATLSGGLTTGQLASMVLG
jgi:hypothetical protein